MGPRRDHPNRLLVEGKDELRVLPELLELAGVPWPKGGEPVWIEEKVGVDSLLGPHVISTTAKASGVQAIGVIVDANGDPAARWRAVHARLSEIDPAVPDERPTGGLIHAPAGKLRLGAWLMPDNVATGMLETMLLALRADAAALHAHARAAIDDARNLGAPVRAAHQAKAELHTWLAWQDPPGRQLHDAVRARLLVPAPEVTAPFVAWFRALFQV